MLSNTVVKIPRSDYGFQVVESEAWHYALAHPTIKEHLARTRILYFGNIPVTIQPMLDHSSNPDMIPGDGRGDWHHQTGVATNGRHYVYDYQDICPEHGYSSNYGCKAELFQFDDLETGHLVRCHYKSDGRI